MVSAVVPLGVRNKGIQSSEFFFSQDWLHFSIHGLVESLFLLPLMQWKGLGPPLLERLCLLITLEENRKLPFLAQVGKT